MFNFLLPAHVKRGKLLLQGVNKFYTHNRDLMSNEQASQLTQARDAYAAALKLQDKESMTEAEKAIEIACQKAVPDYKSDPYRENIEVIIVAIIVALGIRSFLLQPFKIPTSSMQPTLNGIIGNAVQPEAKPNFLVQGWEFLWRGSNYTELRAPESTGPLAITAVEQKSYLLVTRTIVTFSNGETAWCYSPGKQLFENLWIRNEANRNGPFRTGETRSDDFSLNLVQPYEVTPGALLASGRIDTGDQLLVDKVSYHFRRPTRGEVFVFSTVGIGGIDLSRSPGVDSQHYIKRLVGVPGDTVEIDPPRMWINGAEPTEPQIKRVLAAENNPNFDPNINHYHGYTFSNASPSHFEIESKYGTRDNRRTIIYTLNDKQYMACGDNSGHSSDSRVWGAVPEQNLLGPALMVYWPFAPHFGIIK